MSPRTSRFLVIRAGMRATARLRNEGFHAALARFAEAYIEQAYDGVPTPEAISRESERILAHFLEESGAAQIASNPRVRSHVVAARLRNDRGRDRAMAFRFQLAAAWNTLSRRFLGRSLERILFASAAPVIAFDDLPTRAARLDAANVRKALPWRKPRARDLEDVVMIAPSQGFIAGLPDGKLPDRSDFLRLGTRQRIDRWKSVVARSRVLSDELVELCDGNRLSASIESFPVRS